jgi:2-succinyl-6-hydroxy-2,4-cyclohexadiene-1-carboxylate synthase
VSAAGGEEPLPLVLLHGFLGSADDWDEVAWELADTWPVVALDLPGHDPEADTSVASLPRDLPAAARAVHAHLDDLGLGQVDLVGYSLGGRIAAAMAAEAPGRIGRIALLGARLLPDADPQRAARDAAWARRLRDEGLPAFLEAWYAQPLFAGLRGLPGFRAWLDDRAQGDAAALAHLLEALSPSRQPDLVAGLAAAARPTLLLAGAHDTTYVAHAREVVGRWPAATSTAIPEAGHAAHLEAPQAVAAALRAFLAP